VEDIWSVLAEFEGELMHHPYAGEGIVSKGGEIDDPLKRMEYYIAMLKVFDENQERIDTNKEIPVDAATFMDDPFFLGTIARPWPKVREAVIEACSGKYVEAVWTGSIGTGKTTGAIFTIIYHLYRLLLLRDPHKEFGMDPSSEISFIMQSITGGTAFTVDYMRLRRTLEGSPWFQENAKHDGERKSSIRFHDSVIVVEPLPGTETAAIGENVIGGIIDEVNHMKVIKGSSRLSDANATWDQMLENYRAIARRRESRFMKDGKVLGMLCLVGSANYAGQFTDRKKEERDRQLERDGKSSIFIYDKRPWEVQPDGRFSAARFRVFCGDGTQRPRVLKENEVAAVSEEPFMLDVPTDYRDQFDSDLPGAIKDIAGIALHGFSNFIPNYQKITDAFGPRKNIFNPDWCNFHEQGVIIPAHGIRNPKAKRYIHLDLSLQVDYAGFAMGHCSGFTVVDRGGGMKDTLPIIEIDGLLTIKPTGGQQIPIHKLKKLVFALIQMGYPVEWVSLDGFQSADFIQTMRRSGLRSGIVSLDRTPAPYMNLKSAVLDGRIFGPANEVITKELKDIVWVAVNTKVDHPPDGSKDLADAVAGVTHGLSSKTQTWVDHGVDPRKASIMTSEGV